MSTGAFAIAVANPTDLVKVRLQAEGKLPPGVPRRYSGSLNAYSTIVRQVCAIQYNLWKRKTYLVRFSCYYFYSNLHRSSNTQEGVGALWTGLGPNIARNGIINAAELASYDQVKQVI